MPNDIKVYLQDILECVGKIREYTEDVTFEEFESNTKYQDAVIRRLEIIGEAASKISPNFKDNHPEIEWQLMKDMRNKLAHEYFGINYKIIWQVIRGELPEIKTIFQQILENLQT